MTNSHNRTNSHQAAAADQSNVSGQQSSVSGSSSSNTSGRFFANNNNNKHAKKQQQQLNASLNSSQQSNGSSRGGSTYYQNQSMTTGGGQAKGSPSGTKYFGSSNEKFFVPLRTGIGATSTPGKQTRSSPHQRGSPTGINGAVLAQLSSSPPNLSHFAGSKCYDAPAPTALPKPPQHWTGGNGGATTGPQVSMQPAAVLAVPKPKSQAYYQKSGGGVSSGLKGANKTGATKKHVNGRETTMSCSREYLMAAAVSSVSGGGPVKGRYNRSDRNNDYDMFSENLKMVLNVRA